MREQVTQRAPLEQLHDDVEITIFSGAEVGDGDCVRMLHPAGGARFTTKALLRSLVPYEPLA